VADFAPATITAAILAGGKGTRIGGRDKGLELLAGRPLIAHVVEALRGQCGALLICANRNMGSYAVYAPVCVDAVEGFKGPLSGICTALAACASDWLLTVPVDSPRPPPDLANRLHAKVGAGSAAVAHDGQRRQPLFALYRREAAASAAAALAADIPVWRWLEQMAAVEADFSDEHAAFANLNSACEFMSWEEIRRG